MVSVLTTVVLVTATSWRVTAFQAPRTLKRWRPEAARTKILAMHQRQAR